MYYNKVEICGVNTAKLRVLKEQEMNELLIRMQQGDKEAREELICGNLRLVLSVIQKFSNRGENPDDLFQVGCMGLIKAVDHFDLGHGVKFSTYAVPMIIGEIRRHLRDNNPVRVSRSVRELAYRAMAVREKLTHEKQREPTVGELARETGVPKEDLLNAMEAILDPVSIYEPVYTDGGDPICLMDQISDPSVSAESWLDNISLSAALAGLGDREKKILSLRYFAGKTQMEVAEEIGISQAQISRLEKAALLKIRKQL